jgi:hypothetical protein
MGKLEVALKVAEQHRELEMKSSIGARMRASVEDAGQVGGLPHTILCHVAAEAYDLAIEDLKEYVESQSEYPQFVERAARFVSYSTDLIHAIRAKRSFPGLRTLSASKQQELYDRAMDHFDDLKASLRKLESIERDVKIEDVRSTVLVLKVSVYCALAVLVLAFALEIWSNLLPSLGILFDSLSNDFINWVFD